MAKKRDANRGGSPAAFDEIAKLKAEAKAAMDAAKADVEAMILGTKPVA